MQPPTEEDKLQSLRKELQEIKSTIEEFVPTPEARQRSFAWIQKEQRNLRRQSTWLQLIGNVILLMVASLFAFGIYVFLNAEKITDADVNKTLAELERADNNLPAPPPDYSRLTFNAITRFGTLTLIIYAVSVLLNVYRYLVRLSAFCSFRANALSLALELSGREIEHYRKVSEVLAAENIHFGKEPTTPIENALEILKACKDIGISAVKKE